MCCVVCQDILLTFKSDSENLLRLSHASPGTPSPGVAVPDIFRPAGPKIDPPATTALHRAPEALSLSQATAPSHKAPGQGAVCGLQALDALLGSPASDRHSEHQASHTSAVFETDRHDLEDLEGLFGWGI